MIATQEMIYNKLLELEKDIKSLKSANALSYIEEISLNKAVKIMHLGADTVIDLVKKGKLKARTYKTGHKTRYRFRITDVREFQTANTIEVQTEPIDIEPMEDLVSRFFPKNRKKVS